MKNAIFVVAVVVLFTVILWPCESAFGGYLYGTSYMTLSRIDPTDGSWTNINPSPYPSFEGLAYIPEPATLLLFAFGGLVLRKRQ